jgi:geranylgeranyl pyrophosphate synthase
LVHLIGEALGADREDLINAALAVELLHSFTLVHDDIMDQDNIRHGQETIHEKWDESTAILSGDGIYVVSQLVISKIKTKTLAAIKAFNKAALIVCEGQAYDKAFENNYDISLSDYFLMIEKKTAWLIGLCAELSGIISDQTEETNIQLRSFGLSLGRAFQIQDDILEVYGDVETVGKSLGSDLISGKQTILTVLAREENQEEWLSSWKNIKKMETQTAILRLRDYLNRKNIIEKAYKYVEEYVDKARDKLDVIPLSHRDKLKQFTNIILNSVK